MSDIESARLYFLQQAAESHYHLWSALLTINGILVSGFSLLLALSPSVNRSFVALLIVACCVSLLLVLWNILAVKMHYVAQGKRVAGESDTRAAVECEQGEAAAVSLHKWQQHRESVALVLLVIEVLLIGVVVLTMEAAT